MGVRWYWYVSIPKLKSLECENLSWIRGFFSRLTFSIEFTYHKIKASVSPNPSAAQRVGNRIDRIEKAIRGSHQVPRASEISKVRPVFFEFNGYASKFIQGAFRGPKPPDEPGEDFYPSGAFIAAGFEETTGVILIGNANNTYGSALKDAPVSIVSQYPVTVLHTLPERAYSRGDVFLPSVREVYDRCDPYSFVKVRALAVFGAQLRLELQHKQPETATRFSDHFDVYKAVESLDSVIVGSPIYVEQVVSNS